MTGFETLSHLGQLDAPVAEHGGDRSCLASASTVAVFAGGWLAKLQAVERNRETRILRHTMGPTQKAKIKGKATVTVVTTNASSGPTAAPAGAPRADPGT